MVRVPKLQKKIDFFLIRLVFLNSVNCYLRDMVNHLKVYFERLCVNWVNMGFNYLLETSLTPLYFLAE